MHGSVSQASVTLTAPNTVLGTLAALGKLAARTSYEINSTLLLPTRHTAMLPWGRLLPHGFNPKNTLVLVTNLLKARMFSGLNYSGYYFNCHFSTKDATAGLQNTER